MSTETISEADIYASANEPVEQDLPKQQPERAQAQEQPTPNLGQIPSEGEGGQPAQEVPQTEAPAPKPPVMVPVAEVQAQRERRHKAEADLAAREREMAEMRGQMSALQQMFQRQGQPQATPEPPKTFDPFADPEGFTDHRAEQVFKQQLDPFVQQQQRMAQVLDFNNRMIAEQVHTKDAVKAAEEAFNTAAARREIDPMEHARVNNSPNPYAAAVEWHRRQQTLSTVGNDPNKWFEEQLQQRLSSDPEFQKSVFDRLQGQAQAVAPGSGRAPVFTGLPSVNNASGASARGPSTITEEDIYSAAPARMGGR